MGTATGTNGLNFSEHRGHPRRQTMIPATIRLPDGENAACVIRDISLSGARLSLSRRYTLTAAFPLTVPGFDNPFPMRRIWQSGDEAGVMLDVSMPEAATWSSLPEHHRLGGPR
ncbi:PilZ domain-containing protein [Methylobacterium sp. NEAU 140]|uniref:PilZ domain-containing protein n=1 Tax=Methylobacterium sp. NEAU 140 TaxID=3064945 RepID=UPI002736CED4|nr:PilZ domain-containing protein [Methylobacterium sp. NEAU 140]MDP4021829.1 PilZ domain-containing protein [Methylobacterium sp. NEAU 140]